MASIHTLALTVLFNACSCWWNGLTRSYNEKTVAMSSFVRDVFPCKNVPTIPSLCVCKCFVCLLQALCAFVCIAFMILLYPFRATHCNVLFPPQPNPLWPWKEWKHDSVGKILEVHLTMNLSAVPWKLDGSRSSPSLAAAWVKTCWYLSKTWRGLGEDLERTWWELANWMMKTWWSWW